MVQLLSVTCAALGLLHPQLMSPFDCSDSCRTVRGPQEPAWSRGFYARVCDVSLTLRARACYAPCGNRTGHLRRDVCRNAIMCICALWRPPCTAAVCKVLPLWRLRVCVGGLLKGWMSEGIRPSQLPGRLVFRWRWVRSSSGPVQRDELHACGQRRTETDGEGRRRERWRDTFISPQLNVAGASDHS